MAELACMTSYRSLLDTITAGRELPAGCDLWGIRSVWPDFTSRNGFRWAFPGGVAQSTEAILPAGADLTGATMPEGWSE